MMKLKFLNFWYRSAKRFSLLLIVSSIMISGLYAQNMSRYITLNVANDSLIQIDLSADAVNTSIKIVSGTWDTTIIVGKFWTGSINYSSHDTVMTIYGNVNKFECSDNKTKITGIDVSQNTALTTLSCYDNALTSLNVSGCTALCTLYCWKNQLTSLNISGCAALTNLQCYRNPLTSLDVSGCASLKTLYCYSNQLTSLNVSGYTALTTLFCYDNALTSLDVSGCASLKTLYCYSNQLTSLNVSGCTALTELFCYDNQLTSLDLSDCIALTRLTCVGNNFSTQAYNDIMCFLPSRSSNNKGNFFPLNDANDANSAIFVLANASIATAKNWNVVYVYPSNTPIITTGIDTCNPIMNRYITLNVAKDSLIEIRLATDAANSPVRIVSGDSVYNFTTTSTSLTNATSYYAGANTMTIYGDVKTFYCNNNKTKVIGINLSKNTALTELDCSYNQLTSLDLSKNTALTELNCRNNQLTSLDLTACTALTTLYCLFNQLTSLDVSKNVALCTLSCYSNQLTSLNVSDCAALCTLYCYSNQLTSLNVSNNTALTYLSCYSNQLTSLDVSGCTALTSLSCYSNQLTSLDLSKNTALTNLSCGNNQLTSLDVSGCTALNNLSCYSNLLTSLDVSKNTALTSLSCVTNQLTSLDVSKNTALTELSCYENQLTSLNVSGCTALNNLYCENNQLTSLDVSPNTALTRLRCYGNNFSTKAYNDIMCFLPSRSSSDNANFRPLYNTTDTNAAKFLAANASIATAKNWNVVYVNPSNTSIITTGNDSCLSNGTGSSGPVNMNRYITLNVAKESLISIRLATDVANTPIRIVSGDSVYNFTTTSTSLTNATSYYAGDSTMTIYGDVKDFWCYDNNTKITGIDVSKNTALTTLYCRNNQLTSLNVSGCTALTTLYCNSNQLTSLNVSGCTALTTLYCNSNQLTSLNVSGCTALTELYCNENQLTSLNVSGCTALTNLYCYVNNFSTKAYNDIMCFLPSRSSSDDAEFRPLLYATDTNATKFVAANASIATAKNWKVVYYQGGTIMTTTGTAICNPNGGGSMEPVNMNRYITLNVTKDSLIGIDLSADAVNTSIKIVSGTWDTTIIAGTSWTFYIWYPSHDTVMTIYGNVNKFDCMDNQTKIAGIDVSQNTALTTLYCRNNQLTSLNVSGCASLKTLDCYSNQLTSLNVSGCTALNNLFCGNNQLTSLNVSGCAALTDLLCYDNQLISLDLSDCIALTILTCYGNNFSTQAYNDIMCFLPSRSSSDDAEFFPLYDANDANNAIFVLANASIATAKNWNVLYDNGYQITTTGAAICDPNGGGSIDVNMSRYITLNVTKDSLIEISLATDAANTPIRIVSGDSVYDILVTSTSVTNVTSYLAGANTMTIYGDVNAFYCYDNKTKITGIDVSKNTALCTLYCHTNQLTSLDVSGCTALTYFYCYSNQLTSLDVSTCTSLKTLYCDRNQLTSLDVSKNVALCTLYCYSNQLTSLDVSKNLALTNLYCYGNPFSTKAYNDIMCFLPSRSSSDNANFRPLYNATETNATKFLAANAGIATAKNWKVVYYLATNTPITTTGAAICDPNGGGSIDVNMSRYITLNVTKDSLIEISLATDAANTPIRIVSGDSVYDILVTSTSVTNVTSYLAGADTMTIYGDVNAFYCYDNKTKITGIDASNNTTLIELACRNNALTSLNVSGCTALTNLQCHTNQLTSLDVSACTALTNLSCRNNQLTSLDVSKNTALTELDCSYNQLTSLDVSGCTALTELSCEINQLTSLDVSKNTALGNLYCDENQLTSLDLSGCASLKTLYCYDNQLTSLDVSKNTALTNLYCYDNQLTSLNVSGCTALTRLTCYGNNFSTKAYNDIMCSLPSRSSSDNAKFIPLYDATDTNATKFVAANASIATAKNWNVVYYLATNTPIITTGAAICDPNGGGSMEPVNINRYITLNVTKNSLIEISLATDTANTPIRIVSGDSVYDFINANYAYTKYYAGADTMTIYGDVNAFYCYDNKTKITGIDASKNTALCTLYCHTNQLTSLDVSKNTALTYLSCRSNQLTSLDVSKNVALCTLYCDENQLTSLDVSGCTALTRLTCYGNNFSTKAYNDIMCFLPSRSSNDNAEFFPLLHAAETNATKFLAANASIATAKNWKVVYVLSTNTSITTTGTAICDPNGGGSMEPVNMSRYITLNVTKDSLISIRLATDAANTPIRIVSGDSVYNFTTTSTNVTNKTSYYAGADTMTIYGDVNAFYCNDNKTKITGIDASKNTALCTLYCHTNQLTSLDVSQNTALTYLSCRSNQLTSLDVSKNVALCTLYCDENQLTSLDVSKNVALCTLYCGSNQLRSLDVSKNTALTLLNCGYNQLTSLDVSGCTALTYFYCYSNQLTSLDVSTCTSLKTLYCDRNQLTSLDVNGCTALTTLYCYDNQLTSLDVSKNVALCSLSCYENQLTSLDVSKNLALTNLSCYGNPFTTKAYNDIMCFLPSRSSSDNAKFIPLYDATDTNATKFVSANASIATAKNWKVVYVLSTNTSITTTGTAICDPNGGGSMEPVNMSRYITLNVTKNSLIEISLATDAANTPIRIVSGDSVYNFINANYAYTKYYAGADTMTIYGDVKDFRCDDNNTKIIGIDVSKNTALTKLNCRNNQLTSLNVSGCTNLIELYCNNNNLTTLDVSKNTALCTLYCYENQLTSLDVSKNLALTNLYCHGNNFSTKAYNDIMCSLPSRSSSDNAKFIPLLNANDANSAIFVLANASIATAKNWKVLYADNDNPLTTSGTYNCSGGDTTLQVNMSRYITLNVAKDSLIGIDLSADSANTPIKIVSGNWDTTIIAGTNWIGYINYPSYDTIMTIYGDVKSFYCYNNKTKVTEIDVSNNIALCTLYCANNQLTSLDVSNNTALTYLACNTNQLTSLDVSQNTALISLNCHSNQLISLNVRGCTALIELRCYDNDLTSLDLSQNTALISLNCHSNQLTSLDVSNNIALWTLSCYTNQLTSLDLIQNTALTYLECYGNNFSTQAYNDIMCSLPSRSSSDNANFRPLYDATDTNATKFVSANASIATAKNWNVRYSVGGGIITTTGTDSCNQGSGHDTIPTVNMSRYITLTVAKDSLISIRFATDAANTPIRIVSGDSVYDILVTSTSVTNVTSYLAGADTMTIYGDVKEFNCYNNKTKITKIDVSNNIALCTLYCYENNIRALDVSKNTALCTLFCHTNQLTSLDVSACTALTNLSCRNNQLTSLDVSKNTALCTLFCYNNQLTSLDVSNNTSLRTLYCYGNPFTTAEYDAIMCSLPMKETSDNARYYPLYDANDINATKFVASNSKNAIDKNWNVQYGYNDSAIPSTTGDYDCDGGGGEDPEDTTNVTEIKLSNIEIYPNPANSMLTIKNATANVQIFDITGREIMHVENKGEALLQINVSNLSKGMYFVKVGNYTTKFVKE